MVTATTSTHMITTITITITTTIMTMNTAGPDRSGQAFFWPPSELPDLRPAKAMT